MLIIPVVRFIQPPGNMTGLYDEKFISKHMLSPPDRPIVLSRQDVGKAIYSSELTAS